MTGANHLPTSLYGIDLGIPLDERRVVIADESAFNRKTLARFLQWAGISRVEFAENAGAVMRTVERFDADLLILDTTLGGDDGVTLCRRIRQDPRFRDMPIVMQSALNSDHLRTVCFQAGATDVISKPVNPGECIARVRYHLERRALVQELRSFRERIERDLRQARGMQLALVPEPAVVDALAERRGMNVDAVFRSSDEVGGDFWTIFELADGRLGLFAADLSGHGIAAAINAFRLHTLLARVPERDLGDPARLLHDLNGRLNEILPVGQFATAFYGVFDTTADSLLYAAAGTTSPILGTAAGLRAIDSAGPLLGPFAGAEYENRVVSFRPGDHLLVYSDGVTEARDAFDHMLGEAGLLDLMARTLAAAPERPLRRLMADFDADHGQRLRDDLTAIWVARR